MGISASLHDGFPCSCCCFAAAVAAAAAGVLCNTALGAGVVLVDVELPCLLVMRKPKKHYPVCETLRIVNLKLRALTHFISRS